MRTTDVGQLCQLALRGLVSMFDLDAQLFCFRLKKTPRGPLREGISRRYTAIALLGLQRCQASVPGGPFGRIDRGAAFDSLLRDTTWINNAGDLGLLLWLCALAFPERLEEVYTNLNVPGAGRRLQQNRKTMELAWFLSGLAHAGSIDGGRLPGLGDLAVFVYRLLARNQGAGGPFGHIFGQGTLRGVMRGCIGSFADQVYAIYALCKFAEVFQIREALASAGRCADAICRVQGALGQWWWHYHSETGQVIEYHPVYSVHQHGMAPMALFALTQAAGMDFSEPLYKGLRWIAGDNELGLDLRDTSAGVVWRCFYDRKTVCQHAQTALSVLGFAGAEPASALAAKLECRPYELGWLLYALAGRGER